jgi:DNA-directed RNA polymerase subunit M/transcription elongation factor TFIIS
MAWMSREFWLNTQCPKCGSIAYFKEEELQRNPNNLWAKCLNCGHEYRITDETRTLHPRKRSTHPSHRITPEEDREAQLFEKMGIPEKQNAGN